MLSISVIKQSSINFLVKQWGNDHEIEFQEIGIVIFHEIENIAKLIMRSKLTFLGDRKGPRGPRWSLFQVVFSNLT